METQDQCALRSSLNTHPDTNKVYSCLNLYPSSGNQPCYQNYGYNFSCYQCNQDNSTYTDEAIIDSDIQNSTNYNVLIGQRKRGRKPKSETTLSRQENKVNRNSNKKYINYKGVEVEPKEFINHQCKCVKKCTSKLKPDERKAEFDKFWALSSYDAQTAYIAAKVTEHPVKKRYGKEEDKIKKDYTRTYSLCSTTVCREMFCRTLQISSGRINTALTKIRRKTAICDQRGIKKQLDISRKKSTAQKRSLVHEVLLLSGISVERNVQKIDSEPTSEKNCKDICSNLEENSNLLMGNTDITLKANSNNISVMDVCSVIYSNTTKSIQKEVFKDGIDCLNFKEVVPPKKGRKLKYSQTREENKANRNSNKPYTNYKGVLVQPKEFEDFKCKCSKKCYQKIDTMDRYTEFEKFWTLPYNSQTVYIVAAVIEYPVKKHYSQQNSSKKDFSRKYALGTVNVCREMFCRTLHISPGRINTALKKYRSKSALMDQRGLKQGGHNRLQTDKRNSVMRFLKRIPVYKSHYSKESNRTRFLPPDMTVTKLYELYKEEEKDNAVSNASFKKLFYSSFNYKSRESCDICDSYKNCLKKVQNSCKLAQVKERYEKHHTFAKTILKYLDNDISLAKKYPEVECITLEMGKMLPLPRIPQNDMCYKRLLWLYNLSIFSAKRDQSQFYLWPEGQAGKGAQEIGSCIVKYLREDVAWSSGVSHIILWAYAYGGLIRNFKLILMLKCVLQSYPSLKSIKIKFIDTGHCNLPNHKDFIDIDKALKNDRFFLPEDYINVIKSSRKKKPLIVKNMNNNEFLSTEQLERQICNSGTDKYKVNWSDVVEIALYSHQPFTIYYKTTFEGESSNIDITLNCNQPLGNFIHVLVPLWPSGRAITPAKLKDLKSILHLIPESAKQFYLNLQCGTGNKEDVDGLNEQLDFEIEGHNFM